MNAALRRVGPGVGRSGAQLRLEQSMSAGMGITCFQDVIAESKPLNRTRGYVVRGYAVSGSHHSTDYSSDDCAVEIG